MCQYYMEWIKMYILLQVNTIYYLWYGVSHVKANISYTPSLQDKYNDL